MIPRRITVISFLLMSVTTGGTAQSQIELPLGGYYRPGRFMPVLVRSGDEIVRLAGEGVVPTEVRVGGAAVHAPVLVIRGSALESTTASPALPLRPLSDDELLVGLVGSPGEGVERMFPDKRLIALQLDPALLGAGSSVLLEPLDVLVLDRWPDLLRPNDVPYYLGSGVALVVRQGNRPDDRWPWERVAAGWLLRVEPAGPREALIGQGAYLPAQSWHPALPASARRRILLGAAAFTILTLAAALLPRGWAVAGVVGVALAGSAVLVLWHRQPSPLKSIRGQVAVEHEFLTQWDAWTWFASRAGGRGVVDFHADVRPALVDSHQVRQANLRLRWGERGIDRQWSFDLAPRARLAFLARMISPAHATSDLPSTPPGSPMVPLARALYRFDGFEIAGEIEQPPDWAIIVLRKP